MSRPEHTAPADLFYDKTEAKKYAQSSRMIQIQTSMANRAVELLRLPDKPCYLLDVGCGSGLSGEVLSELGHTWIGADISEAMLGVANERGCEGDLLYTDMGQGLHFRPGTFDGCISISALQWLCNADHRDHVPQKRLKIFFTALYKSLVKGGRAIFQFYPETPQQMELITTQAMKSGFSGGLVVDYPNSTKAKKIFLCLFAGEPAYDLPTGKAVEEEKEVPHNTILFTAGTNTKFGGREKKGKRKGIKDKAWAKAKKERYRKQGKEVAADSKFSGRKRGPRF